MTRTKTKALFRSNSELRHRILPFAVAISAATVALLLTQLLWSFLNPLVFILFYGAVAASAWYGGLGAGLLTIALSIGYSVFFFIPPVHTFAIPNVNNLVQIATFSLISTLITLLCTQLRIAQQKAERALKLWRDSELRFSRLTESNIIGVTVADLHGSILEANDAFLNLVGYTREDLLAKRVNWREMTPPEDAQSSEQSVQELEAVGFLQPFEKEFIRKDGAQVSVLFGAALLSNPQEFIGFVLNLSDRKRAEVALQEAAQREQQLRLEAEVARNQINGILESITDAFVCFDQDWRYIYVNEQAAKLLHQTRENLLGKRVWKDVFPEAAQNPTTQEIRRAAQEQVSVVFEEFSQSLNVWLEIHAYPSPIGLSIYFRDITDRKQTEAALQQAYVELEQRATQLEQTNQELHNALEEIQVIEEELQSQNEELMVARQTAEMGQQRYQDLFNLAPDGYLVTDANGRIQEANQTIAALLLSAPNELISVPLAVYVSAADSQTFNALLQQLQRQPQPQTHELHLQCLQGNPFPAAITVTAIQNSQGNLIGFRWLIRDISERKRTEENLQSLLAKLNSHVELEQAARVEAEKANRTKDEFLAVLSHELRSPLNPILGWAKLLQTYKFDESKTVEALATIERNAKILTQLIDDLLDVSRILRGKLTLNVETVDLAFVIESAIETVQTAAIAKSIQIETIFSNVGQISGDAARLQQVVWNLLANAIKFTPRGGRVEVRLERIVGDEQRVMGHGAASALVSTTHDRPASYVQIVVSDTGRGISPAFLPHVFEYFRQADASITRMHGGLGLGLAIVRCLVELHGGTVSVDSPGDGQGATFTVSLPLLEGQPEMNEGSFPNREIDLTGTRILIVDDEFDSRQLLNVILQQYGAETMAVASAHEAFAAIEPFKPDILVSDISMPDEDGYSLLKRVRALSPEQGGQTPAIALTAYAREEDQQKAYSSGFQIHLSKPVDPIELAAAAVELTQKEA
jgi:PAS domain S-box-containing protein